jgi:hypothetical protein
MVTAGAFSSLFQFSIQLDTLSINLYFAQLKNEEIFTFQNFEGIGFYIIYKDWFPFTVKKC